MKSVCVVCGRSDSGRMRSWKDKWYCHGGFTGENHNKCFSDKFSEKTTTVRRVQVRVICPHCNTDVSDAWNTDADYDVCPGCGALFWESYEDCVYFIREIQSSSGKAIEK